jgi:D-lactate dehydrogenase
MELAGQKKEYEELLSQSRHEVLDTCAVDGLCATACPVDINTGDLVKRLRRENHSASVNRQSMWVAKHFAFVERLVRRGLQVGHLINRVFGRHTMTRLTKAMRKLVPAMPLWSTQLPKPPALGLLSDAGSKRLSDATPTIVYFPACITRVMGTYPGKKKNLMETFLSVSKKAGIEVVMPGKLEGSCCSQIFGSKGFAEAQRHTAAEIIDRLWKHTEVGRLPVVIDVSSCAYTLHHIRPVLDEGRRAKFDKLTILDTVDYLHDMVLPRVGPVQATKQILLHPVCSLEKMKTGDKLLVVARHFARAVTVPVQAGCCGMAGDRGFLFPELTASATAAEAAEVNSQTYDGYYSTTRTCEMAMSEAVKQNYQSLLYLVDEGMAEKG